MSGKRVAQPDPNVQTKGSRNLLWIPVLIIVLLASAAAGLCWYANTYPGIFPGVTAAEGRVELAGLSPAEARKKLEETIPALLEESVHQVELDGEVLATYTAAQVGYSPNLDLMAEQAWAAGRDGNLLTNTLSFAKGFLGAETDISLYLDWNAEQTQTVIDEVAALVEKPAVDGSYSLTRDGLYATKQQDGITLDREQLRTMFATWKPGNTSRLECPVKVTPAKALDVDAMAEALSASPAAPARYDIALGKVVDGTVGVELEAEAARYVLEATAAGESVLLPAAVNYPEMTAAELESVLFRDLLGTNTTSVSGTAARRANVKLAGELVNGTILNDGDIFDYNLVVGERTEERGFGPAASYVNGETVDTVGGGICQVSSTVYLSALLSNLEIVERYNHRFYPGYITLGMDATVSWGGPEFRFKNNTGYPIRIDVTYENSELTVSFYGTKTDDTYVKMTREVLSTTGYETEYVETEELPWGTQQEKQNGYTGRKVKTYRNIYSGDGTLISSTLEATSDYKSRNQIILVGTAGRPIGTETPNTGNSGSGSTEGSNTTQQPEETPPIEEQPNEMPEWLLPRN